jgi:hypothetical protein
VAGCRSSLIADWSTGAERARTALRGSDLARAFEERSREGPRGGHSHARATTPRTLTPSQVRATSRSMRLVIATRAMPSMGWIPDPPIPPPRPSFIRSARKTNALHNNTMACVARLFPGSTIVAQQPRPGRRSASRKVRPRAIADPAKEDVSAKPVATPAWKLQVRGWISNRRFHPTTRDRSRALPPDPHARPADLSGSLPRASITTSRDRRATLTLPAPPPHLLPALLLRASLATMRSPARS